MRYRNYFFIFLATITILRLLYISTSPFGLVPDEAHYWEWSRRLDLSYYSKGPAVAYIIALFTALFGNNEFGVRIGAVVLSVIGSTIFYFVARDIFKSTRAGFFAALVPSLTPLYSAGSILMTTDAPFIISWGLTCYFIRRALIERSVFLWSLAGLFTGVGLLSKYTMALIFPCLLLYLLSSKDNRKWLVRAEPYLALFISLLIFSPVIIWNVQNDFVTIRHTMGQAHVEAGLRFSLSESIEFIGSQVGLLTPLIFAGVIYAIWVCGLRGHGEGRKDHRLLFFMSAPVLIFFLIKSFQGKVQANWTAPGYFTAFIATAGVWDEIYTRCKRAGKFIGLMKGTISFALFLPLTLSVLMHYPSLLESMGVNGILERAPYNRIVGWREAGVEVGKVYSAMNRLRPTFIVSDTYQTASELAFYMPENPVVYNVYLGNRRMNQYDLWAGFDRLTGSDVLYVKGGDSEIEEAFLDAFDGCVKEVKRIYRGKRLIRTLSLFRCSNFKGLTPIKEGWSY